MSLLTALGLAPPKNVAAVVPGVAVRSGASAGAGKPPGSAKTAKPQVIEGEIRTVVAKKESLGKLYWERRYKGDLGGFTDAAGKLVTGGPRPGWRAMALGNLYGRRVVAALADLDNGERDWRALADRVHKGTADGAALMKKTDAAMGAVRQRKAKDSEFRAKMRDYFNQIDTIETLALDVDSADAEFNEKLKNLEIVVTEGKIRDAGEEVEEVKGEIAQVKANAEQAKAIFAKVLSIGAEIRNFAVAPSVTALIGHISEGVTALAGVVIDGQYAGKLGALEAQLNAAMGKLKSLEDKKYALEVEKARFQLVGAVARCKKAEKVFTSAVKQLAYKRADATDESKESPATKIIAEVISRRAQQRQAIDHLRSGGAAWLKLLEGVSVGVAKLAQHYAFVGDWIDDIAVGDALLARGSAWANRAELTASQNAVLLGNWTAYLPYARTACQTALKGVDDGAAAGAMAPYDGAMALVDEALGQAAG